MESLMNFVTTAYDQHRAYNLGEVMVAPEDSCEDAQLFQAWIDRELISKVSYSHDVLKINQAMFMLQRKYFEARSAADREHKDYMGDHHICIYRVYITAYADLNRLLLWETPPQILSPGEMQQIKHRSEPKMPAGQFVFATSLGDEIEEG